jgi:hypothetical protein
MKINALNLVIIYGSISSCSCYSHGIDFSAKVKAVNNMTSCNTDSTVQISTRRDVVYDRIACCMMDWINQNRATVTEKIWKKSHFSKSDTHTNVDLVTSYYVDQFASYKNFIYIYHIPHFSELYFSLFSSLMWHNTYLNFSPKIRTLIIEINKSYWKPSAWVVDLIGVVESFIGWPTVIVREFSKAHHTEKANLGDAGKLLIFRVISYVM